MSKIKIYDVKWTSTTAGPSPLEGNQRVEIFMRGCKKAATGNPCSGCFNPGLWHSDEYAKEIEVSEVVDHINEISKIKYVTIVGGEPFDQPEALAELCKGLKSKSFHIILFTHYTKYEILKWIGSIKDFNLNYDLASILNNIDILIDGEYVKEEHIYNEEEYNDGFHNAVGSGNQVIWNMHNNHGYSARDLEGIAVNYDNELIYIVKDTEKESGAELIVNDR